MVTSSNVSEAVNVEIDDADIELAEILHRKGPSAPHAGSAESWWTTYSRSFQDQATAASAPVSVQQNAFPTLLADLQ